MYNSLSTIYKNKILLKEYTEKAILGFIEKFKLEGGHNDEKAIRNNIIHFEKIKDSDRFKKLMPKILPNVKTPTDINSYSYTDLVSILNWFEGEGAEKYKIPLEPQEAPGAGPERLPQGDAVGLEIYIAHNYEQARYLALDHFKRFYNYCVRVRSHWNQYRYKNKQTFYFVYDPSKPEKDPHHLLVIRPFYYNDTTELRYAVSTGVNADSTWLWGDEPVEPDRRYMIKKIIEAQPKLATLKNLFRPREFTARERQDIALGDKKPEDFRELDYYTKFQYITLGHKIYAKDYELLDKDLQNTYINAQDNWENIEITQQGKNIIVSGLYSLIYPFAVSEASENYGSTNTDRKLLGLYISLKLAQKPNDFTPLLKIHDVINEGSTGAKKRYLFLLERHKARIYKDSVNCAINLIDTIINIRSSQLFKTIYKNEEDVGIIHTLPSEHQKIYIKTKQIILLKQEFKSLQSDVQQLYITEWFERNGMYMDKKRFMHSKSVLAPFEDLKVQEVNELLNSCQTIEEFVDRHPVIGGSSQSVKDTFLQELQKFLSVPI